MICDYTKGSWLCGYVNKKNMIQLIYAIKYL